MSRNNFSIMAAFIVSPSIGRRFHQQERTIPKSSTKCPVVMMNGGILSALRSKLSLYTPQGRSVGLIWYWFQGRSIRESMDFYSMKTVVRDRLPLAGQKMVDDGVLELLRDAPKSGDTILSRYRANCTHPKDMDNNNSCFIMLNKLRQMHDSHCCKCLYLTRRCICDSITKVEPYNKIWLFQSLGEYGRNNNSGSLLCLVTNARRTFRGIEEQENEMLQFIEKNPHNSVVVFPSENAITIKQYRKQRIKKGVTADDPITFILLDGTPNEASRLERNLPPSLPRVCLKRIPRDSWLQAIRGCAGEGRVCTAQGKFFNHLYASRILFTSRSSCICFANHSDLFMYSFPGCSRRSHASFSW